MPSPLTSPASETERPAPSDAAVRVAALLVTLPALLVTTTLNCAPLSLLVVAGVV